MDTQRTGAMDDQITPSSGNVFADLELPDADETKLKSDLVIQIRGLIDAKGWTQTEAAEMIGLTQPQVSQLMRGHVAGFSIDRLFTIITRLGHTVEVRISPDEAAPRDAHMRLVA